MEAKLYPENKRRDLIQRSKEDFVEFLIEVTDYEGKQFIEKELLPNKVKGFRPGHAPLTRTVPMLIRELKKEQELTNNDSVIWNKFKNAWKAWVISHAELNQVLLESFNNEADFDENLKCIAPPNSELDIQCFKSLLEASRNYYVDQETIRRFYEYGYFLPSDEIENLIEKALPKSETERQLRLAALPAEFDKLSQTINNLNSRVASLETATEAEQTLDRRIAEAIKSFEPKLSESKSSFNKRIGKLRQSINSIESSLSELSELKKSVKSTQLSAAEFVNDIKQDIAQLDQRIHERVKPFEARCDTIDQTIAAIRTEREEQRQTTDAPRIAYQALQIGEHFAANLGQEEEHYQNERDYLEDFRFSLRRFGVTDSDEMAAASHVALKAFPALEVIDTRMIEVWRLMCDFHSHLTKIEVEIGWLGLQDWFPGLFSQECFGEKLRPIDLDISIRKMLEIGGMPWAIHLSNCDRSFTESYLPRFLDWVGDFSDGGIRVFLTRCTGTNRCETNQDVYVRVARLPRPQGPEPIEAQNLRPSGIIVTLSEWESWCRPNLAVHQHGFLNQIQEAIENRGNQIPMVLLREIQQYLRLSHDILAPSRSLDWALTLRLLPWIENRPELIDTVQNLINRENLELPNFQKEIRQAKEESA